MATTTIVIAPPEEPPKKPKSPKALKILLSLEIKERRRILEGSKEKMEIMLQKLKNT